jgi:hypothetical protein
LFWKEVADDVIRMVLHHTASARQERSKSFLLKKSGFLENDLLALESAARRTLSERDKTLVFLKSYLVQ